MTMAAIILPVKAAIDVGKNHKVLLMMMMMASASTASTAFVSGQKTDERTSNQNWKNKQLKPAQDGFR